MAPLHLGPLLPGPSHALLLGPSSWHACSHPPAAAAAVTRLRCPLATAAALVAASPLLRRRLRRPRCAARAMADEEDKEVASEWDQFPTGWEEFRFLAGEEALSSGLPTKMLHLVRHAQSESNAAGAAFPREDPRRKAVYEDGLHFDSPLSELGLASCQNFRAEGSAPQVELVACSPLTRAVQTASEIFGFGPASGSDRIVTGTSVPGPLVVLEVLREFNSSVFHPSDARRRR
ncbi:unnamed protein product, partial [Polarella glacialis]